MNQTDKINLSKRVAEKYGVHAYEDKDVTMVMNEAGHTDGYRLWLADDSARCFELAVE